MSDMNTTNEPQGQSVDQQSTEVNAAGIRKSTTQSILKAASQASGMDFDSVEALAAALARLGSMSQQVQPQVQQVEPQQSKRLTTTDLQDQFQALRQDLAKKDQLLRERELDQEIRSSMGDRFDSDLIELALSKVKSNIQWEDGTYQITNSKGQVRYGEDGNPLTISGLVNEVAKANPKLLRAASGQNTGSGLRPREGMFGATDSEVVPDYTQDPAAFNAWAQRNGLGKGVGLKGVKASVFNSSTVNRIV